MSAMVDVGAYYYLWYDKDQWRDYRYVHTPVRKFYDSSDNPEDVLTRNGLAEPHRIYATNQEREDDQIRALSRAFMDNLKKELLLS